MGPNDKTLLAEKLNTLQEVYGKPKITVPAFQVWWETLREFDHSDVFTVLGYWPTCNSKPPLPADVWKVCNEKRTESLEAKAARERASNRATIPHDFRPTEYGRRMLKECFAIMAKKRRPEGRREWAEKILRQYDDGERVPFITMKLAMDRIAERGLHDVEETL